MDFNVIVASPVWSLNGVNVFSANLVRGLRAQGISAHILLTQKNQPDSKPMPLPSDIPVDELPVEESNSWLTRWQVMLRYLEERAPCIYIPNYDFEYSCVSPKLSNRVGVVGIIHSDDPQHYEHVRRLGRYWNAIVAVSKAIAEQTVLLDPTLSTRLVTIPYGVSIPHSLPKRLPDSNVPLKIVYTGGLKQYQKRILDLPKIIQASLDLQIPVKLTIAGGGPDQQPLLDASKHLVEQGVIQLLGIVPNERIPEILEQHDVFIMTSEFEGLPNALLEAMGRGCVPVVTDIGSGIPELVHDGVNGYRVPVGNIRVFAERLASLQREVTLRREMSLNAYFTVDKGGYRIQDMAQRYINLFHHVLREAETRVYCRPRSTILPPPDLQPLWKHYLPASVRKLGSHGKRVFNHIGTSTGSSPQRD